MQALINKSIALEVNSDAEAALELLDLMRFWTAQLKQARAMATEALIEWIDGNGDLEMGEKRWYVGTTKRVKLRDSFAAAEALLDATGGDLVEFCEALASEPFKQGHMRTVLGDAEHERLFSVDIVKDLKTGKPRREVKQTDKRFSAA